MSLIARVITAAVFGIAGLAKLADPRGTRRAIEGFGVPSRLAAPGTWLLPLTEIAVAVLVVVPPTAWWGALGALVLLATFTTGVLVTLGRGQTPDCRCFGRLVESPTGTGLLVRNTVIAVPVLLAVLFS